MSEFNLILMLNFENPIYEYSNLAILQDNCHIAEYHVHCDSSKYGYFIKRVP